MEGERSGSGVGNGNEDMTSSGTLVHRTPKQVRVSTALGEQVTATEKTAVQEKSVSACVTRHIAGGQEGDGKDESDSEAASLIVKLRFSHTRIASLQRILVAPESRRATPDTTTPSTPSTTQNAPRAHIPQFIQPGGHIPLFSRPWVDETKPFNVRVIRATLRPSDEPSPDLGAKYHWYASAVHIDAIFPPGIALSAKEIAAYYPHHVRWKGVMLRLAKNDYRGADILGMQALFRGPPTSNVTPAQMNNYMRDTVKTQLPDFRVVGYMGKGERKLWADTLPRGKYLDDSCKAYTLPTFDDLLRGLRCLPTGLDARDLTQCLSWYLGTRNLFIPPLELNVLHVRDLVHALREPLRPFGPQNLDRNALQEWRETQAFDTVNVRFEPGEQQKGREDGGGETGKEEKRTQLHMNLDNDSMRLHLKLPLRHVLTFPFLALHGVLAQALELGIRNAERQRKARKEGERERVRGESSRHERDVENGRGAGVEVTCATQITKQQSAHSTGIEANERTVPTQEQTAIHRPSEEMKRYRIPKRPRPTAQDELEDIAPLHPRRFPPASTPFPSATSSFNPPTGPRTTFHPPPPFSTRYTPNPFPSSQPGHEFGGGRWQDNVLSRSGRRRDGGYGYAEYDRGSAYGGRYWCPPEYRGRIDGHGYYR